MSGVRGDILPAVSRQPGFDSSHDSRRARSGDFSMGPEDQEEEWRSPKRRRVCAGFATRSTEQPLVTLSSYNSPSSASTTSLAQLREKLITLPPIRFTQALAKIAATPELPTLIEKEYELSSNSEPNPHCGVSRRKQYHSDSEVQKGIKNTRYLPTVVDEHSASLTVAAAHTNASTDQSTIIQVFEELLEDPPVDLANLIIVEPLNHEQDKDSGIISGKVTQDSDIVENTPFTEIAHRNKFSLKPKPKYIEEIRYTTDDSDVVDDTPCYDYDWRKRRRTNSVKANKNNNDENETLNEKAVDAYFCQQQQTNINYHLLISPATIKKVSESLSRDEDIEDDCIIIEDIEIDELENNKLNLPVEADIIDCVNDVLDNVCINLDKCVDLLADQQQEIYILRAVNNIDTSSNTHKILKMNKDTFNSPKDITNELDTDGVQKVTLNFKPKKQAPNKNSSRQKKAKCVKSPNNNNTDFNQNMKSPTNATKQLIGKKRKLYSPKDDNNENNEIPRSRKERRPSSSTESPIAACYQELENARKSRTRLPRKKASTQPVISPKTKNLNDMFDKIKANVVNNEKITLVNKKSDKNLQNSLYNKSSESDDEVFQKKKIQVQKHLSSSSLESVSKRGRPVKPVDYTSYYSSDECQRVAKPKVGKQTKPRGHKAKIIQKSDLIDERIRNKQPEVLETSFVQEKGDMNVPEESQPLVNVPVLETIPTGDIHDDPIVSRSKPQTPNKQEVIRMKTKKSLKKRCRNLTKSTVTKRSKETFADDSHDESVVSGRRPQIPSKQEIIQIKTENISKKRSDKLAELAKRSKEIIVAGSHGESIVSQRKPQTLKPTITKRNKTIIKNVQTERESATVSPLPGLIVEKEPRIDEMTFSLDANLLQKLEKISTDMANLTTIRDTHLLLNENNNNNDRIKVASFNKTCNNQNVTMNLDNSNDSAVAADNLQAEDIPDIISENLMVAGGRSPITADNDLDLDESPPNSDALNKSFQQRDVDTESRSESLNEFLVNMRTLITKSKSVNSTSPIIPITRITTKYSMRSNLSVENISELNRKPSVTSCIGSNKTNPRVVLERISSEDIESQIDSVTPKSKVSASRVVLTRSSEEIENVETSTSTKKPSATESTVVVLDRISSDEINKWLPMPKTKDVIEKEPNIVPRKTLARRKSVLKPCISCENFEQKVSPVKLNFDIVDFAKETSIRDIRSNRCSVKPTKSSSNILQLRTKSVESLVKKVNDHRGISSQETVKSAEMVESEMRNSVTSVRNWMKKNAEAGSSKSNDQSITKEMLYQELMEVVNTRLVEINKATVEAMQAAFSKDKKELECLVEQVCRNLEEAYQKQIDSFKKQIAAFEKNKEERACSLISAEVHKRELIVQLLREDITRYLK